MTVETKTAAAIRELYIAHKLSYIAANAQLRLFCGMGEHKADMFLSDQPLTQEEAIARKAASRVVEA